MNKATGRDFRRIIGMRIRAGKEHVLWLQKELPFHKGKYRDRIRFEIRSNQTELAVLRNILWQSTEGLNRGMR